MNTHTYPANMQTGLHTGINIHVPRHIHMKPSRNVYIYKSVHTSIYMHIHMNVVQKHLHMCVHEHAGMDI